MKTKTKLVLSISLFGIALLLFLLSMYHESSIIEKKPIPTSLNISDKAGFDLNGTALTFGNLLPGTSSRREIVLKNNHEFPIEVEIEVEGNIQRYLEFEKEHRIEPGKTKEISFVAKIPEEGKKGNYSGRVFAIIKKA